jgi:peptidoglycan/LPS O-acetylase OafA/YrhL
MYVTLSRTELSPIDIKSEALGASRALPHLASPKYRADVDGLRAVAVAAVVVFHAFPNTLAGGFIGVDVFFVISGFLISTVIFENLERDSFSYRDFYARRIKRIFPALIVVLITCAIVGWYVLLADEYEQLGKHILAAAGFSSNFLLWTESGYFDSDSDLKPLLHLWSLGIEEQFYLVWPLLLSASWNKRNHFLKITIIVAILSFSVNILIVRQHPIAAFYSPATRIWELMVGGALAYMAFCRPDYLPRTSHWRSIVGLALILLCAIFLGRDHPFPGFWALLPTGGAFLIISAGPEAWLNRTALSSRPFVAIGFISYPLYLWHWPLLSFTRIIENGEPSSADKLALIAIAVILSTITYQFIERPIRFKDRGFRTSYYLIVGMCSVGLIGAGIELGGGVRSRVINNNPTGFEFGLGNDDDMANRCFLLESERLPFDRICDGTPGSARPLVLMWGDSHAKSISLGLSDRSRRSEINFAQFTSSGCPPLIDTSVAIRPECTDINAFIAEKIAQLKPKTVILSAFWALYNGHNGWTQLDYDKLKATVAFLKNSGVDDVIVVGNLPTYLVGLPRLAVEMFVAEKVDRTFYKFDERSRDANETLKQFASENNVKFVSPIDIFCNVGGCLLSTSKNILTPVAWDYGHLTKSGAIYLVDEAIRKHELVLP